jgi:metallo-beta-lactamase class B
MGKAEPAAGRRTRLLLRSFLALLVIAPVAACLLLRYLVYDGWQKPAEPFHIADNLYFVGANDVAAFLLTGPEGHVLIDGGYAGTAPMIMDSIAKLGFRVTDVKLLLNSHGHFDHAGGLAALKKASGAQLWVSEGDADAVESGGARDVSLGPWRFLAVAGVARYPPAKVDRRLNDGAVVRLGPTRLTAHLTPGPTRGCTSWSFPVQHRGRELLAVHICSLNLPPMVSLVQPDHYPGVRRDFENSFRKLRDLPADVYLAPHSRQFDRERKLQAREAARDKSAPFIDPTGYRLAIDKAERHVRATLADESGE